MIPRFLCTALALMVTVASSPRRVGIAEAPAQPAGPRVTVLHDDPGATVLKIEVSGFAVHEFRADGKTYRSIDLLTDIATTQPGSPELPYIAKMLAIPDRGGVTAEVIGMEGMEKFPGYPLPPARMSRQEGAPEPAYVENQAAYRLGGPPELSVDEPVVFRDFRVARVAVYPVRYVPATREVQVASSVTVRITYGGGTRVTRRPQRSVPSRRRSARCTGVL